MSSRPAAPLLAACIVCAALFAASTAHAQAGHREVFVTSSAHVIGSPAPGGDATGPGAGLSVFYGLTPQLGAGVVGRFTWALATQTEDEPTHVDGPSWAALAALGYNFDVFVVIPFLSAGVGVVGGDGLFEGGSLRPGASISLGADWRPRRAWALGFQLDNLWRIGGPGGTTPALGFSLRFTNIIEPGGL